MNNVDTTVFFVTFIKTRGVAIYIFMCPLCFITGVMGILEGSRHVHSDYTFMFIYASGYPPAYSPSAPAQQQHHQYQGGYPSGASGGASAAAMDGTRSTCTGNKKALLIGINYFGQSGELRGCINDVNNIRRLIQSRGFSDDYNSMRILTDDQRDPGRHPTRRNIIEGVIMMAFHDILNSNP